MSAIKYTLKTPVNFGSETYTELEFNRPKIKHLKKLDKVQGDIAKTAEMISLCANIVPPVVDEIDAGDVAEISKILEGFF